MRRVKMRHPAGGDEPQIDVSVSLFEGLAPEGVEEIRVLPHAVAVAADIDDVSTSIMT